MCQDDVANEKKMVLCQDHVANENEDKLVCVRVVVQMQMKKVCLCQDCVAKANAEHAFVLGWCCKGK